MIIINPSEIQISMQITGKIIEFLISTQQFFHPDKPDLSVFEVFSAQLKKTKRENTSKLRAARYQWEMGNILDKPETSPSTSVGILYIHPEWNVVFAKKTLQGKLCPCPALDSAFPGPNSHLERAVEGQQVCLVWGGTQIILADEGGC